MLLASVAATAMALPASAQDSEDDVGLALEEIVVTAQKRVESLGDVPITVNVMDGAKIESQRVESLLDLADYMPGLYIKENTVSTNLFVRGVGSGNNQGFEQSVGTYVDGIYFGRPWSAANAFVDLERVEVLKGPQGTLFGKNTIAGAMNLTTRKPGEEFGGYALLGYAPNVGGFNATVAVDMPLSETFAVRAVARYSDSDGNVYAPRVDRNVNGRTNKVGRISARWNASEDLTVNLKAEMGEVDYDGTSIEGVRA